MKNTSNRDRLCCNVQKKFHKCPFSPFFGPLACKEGDNKPPESPPLKFFQQASFHALLSIGPVVVISSPYGTTCRKDVMYTKCIKFGKTSALVGATSRKL